MGTARGQRTSSSTTEGTITVAAGLALNIQKIVTGAYVDDGLLIVATGEDTVNDDDTITRDGIVEVQSLALNDSTVVANGSASQGKVGVGVAVAINIVNYTNEAVFGDSPGHGQLRRAYGE